MKITSQIYIFLFKNIHFFFKPKDFNVNKVNLV